MIDDIVCARAVHVLALVHWIGGVTAVTTIILPHAKKLSDPREAVAAFESFERPFAFQARISILLVGLTGIYMLFRMRAWQLLQHPAFWWLHLMVAVWLLFAIMVYVLEPLFLHYRFREAALHNKEFTFSAAIVLHAAALTAAAAAILAGILGAEGGFR